VDLLGDEVEALTNLLAKIYTALDHYSPVLQHYTGVSFVFTLWAVFFCFLLFLSSSLKSLGHKLPFDV
jgi:hypothetical protein